MAMKMLPILETLEPGATITIAGIKWGTVTVDNWNYVMSPGDTGMQLQQSPTQATTTTTAYNDDGHEIQLQVVVGDNGYLFGDGETMQLTTEQGAAAGTITINRHETESRALSEHYSLH